MSKHNPCGLIDCPTCQSIGSFNRLPYDKCAYMQRLQESTSPLNYQMYEGKFQSCNKCLLDGVFHRPFDANVVQIESELKNILRPNTSCNVYKYNPNCKTSRSCISTFNPNVPVISDRNVCPVVFNNIPKSGAGYVMPGGICGQK